MEHQQRRKNEGHLFLTEVFFVNSISEIFPPINSTIDLFYYNSTFGIILNYEILGYDNGFINKLTTFAKYYNIFNKANAEDLKVFLYNRNGILTTNLLINNENFLSIKDSPNINYLIFKCRFITSVLKFKYGNYIKKVLLPISQLKEFIPVTINEVFGLGIIKGNLIVKEF